MGINRWCARASACVRAFVRARVVCLYIYMSLSSYMYMCVSRGGELRTHKLKSHLMRTQSLNVLPLVSGVGQYTLTARDFFLAYFYPSGPFICIFPKTSPDFSCVDCG